ncbi:MAG TPA: SRPBCC domain-containing protein [Pyrinomonadaceae bacterium]|nr:SRPBCC domain-containing protein [Pyrinomonadaceae bacterium]
MSTDNPFDFVVDKEAKTVSITKEFAAGLDLVWDAYTKAELLDQWWAPKPFASHTKVLDFEVGGRRFYAMVGPDGTERWAVQKYTSITPKTNFKFFNAFADADENLQLPGSDWNFDFIDQGDTTTVSVSIYNESLERMEMILASGFTEGVKVQLQNLVELLARLSQHKGTEL